MPKKELYFYEEVAEPTGIASKYWDAPAPTERASKVLANEAAASRNKTFMASQSPSWHARTSQERRADLQSFIASQRRLDKAASAAQVPTGLIPTNSTMQDTGVVKAVPAKEPGIHLGKYVALDMDKGDSGKYEQLRAKNIARNNEILSGLGFAPMEMRPPTKKKRRGGTNLNLSYISYPPFDCAQVIWKKTNEPLPAKKKARRKRKPSVGLPPKPYPNPIPNPVPDPYPCLP